MANKFMELAINEAKKGIHECHGGPFGAVVVKDGEIVASGHNHVVANNDPTCHGEIDAIRKACKKLQSFDLSGCELYTTGFPCPMCLGAIIWANIKKVYFGCAAEDAEAIGFRDEMIYKFLAGQKTASDVLELAELDREECLKLFDEYFAMANKTAY